MRQKTWNNADLTFT